MDEDLPPVELFDAASIYAQNWLREFSTVWVDPSTNGKEVFELYWAADSPVIVDGIQFCRPLIVAAERTASPIAEFRLFRDEAAIVAPTAHDIAWEFLEVFVGASWTYTTARLAGRAIDTAELERLTSRMERERIIVRSQMAAGLQQGSYSMSDLRRLTGFDDNSQLNGYLKAIGCTTAGRGEKNWKCTHSDAVKVLRHVGENASPKNAESARKSVRKLTENRD